MIQTIWGLVNRILSSPSYDRAVVKRRLEQTQAQTAELTARLNCLANQRDPYGALLLSMQEARDRRHESEHKNE